MSKANPSGAGADRTQEKILKTLVDINGSMGEIQRTLRTLKSDVDKRFEEMNLQRMDDLRNVTARVATIGNQISYFRQTVCECMKDNVSAEKRNYKSKCT